MVESEKSIRSLIKLSKILQLEIEGLKYFVLAIYYTRESSNALYTIDIIAFKGVRNSCENEENNYVLKLILSSRALTILISVISLTRNNIPASLCNSIGLSLISNIRLIFFL